MTQPRYEVERVVHPWGLWWHVVDASLEPSPPDFEPFPVAKCGTEDDATKIVDSLNGDRQEIFNLRQNCQVLADQRDEARAALGRGFPYLTHRIQVAHSVIRRIRDGSGFVPRGNWLTATERVEYAEATGVSVYDDTDDGSVEQELLAANNRLAAVVEAAVRERKAEKAHASTVLGLSSASKKVRREELEEAQRTRMIAVDAYLNKGGA